MCHFANANVVGARGLSRGAGKFGRSWQMQRLHASAIFLDDQTCGQSTSDVANLGRALDLRQLASRRCNCVHGQAASLDQSSGATLASAWYWTKMLQCLDEDIGACGRSSFRAFAEVSRGLHPHRHCLACEYGQG
jgi:hypothetical protein